MKRKVVVLFTTMILVVACGSPTGPGEGPPPIAPPGTYPAIPAPQMLKTAAGVELPFQSTLPVEPSPARGQVVPVSRNCINDHCFTARVRVEFVNNPTGATGAGANLKVCLSINGTDEMSCRTGNVSNSRRTQTFDLGPWILPGALPQWLVVKAEYYDGVQFDPIIGETRYALGYRR